MASHPLIQVHAVSPCGTRIGTGGTRLAVGWRGWLLRTRGERTCVGRLGGASLRVEWCRYSNSRCQGKRGQDRQDSNWKERPHWIGKRCRCGDPEKRHVASKPNACRLSLAVLPEGNLSGFESIPIIQKAA